MRFTNVKSFTYPALWIASWCKDMFIRFANLKNFNPLNITNIVTEYRPCFPLFSVWPTTINPNRPSNI